MLACRRQGLYGLKDYTDNMTEKIIFNTEINSVMMIKSLPVRPPASEAGQEGVIQIIKEKIFQPFFTTKPTGSGTDLGLSLSYDIVKVHGGVMKVVSKEGEGTEFLLNLPVHG